MPKAGPALANIEYNYFPTYSNDVTCDGVIYCVIRKSVIFIFFQELLPKFQYYYAGKGNESKWISKNVNTGKTFSEI